MYEKVKNHLETHVQIVNCLNQVCLYCQPKMTPSKTEWTFCSYAVSQAQPQKHGCAFTTPRVQVIRNSEPVLWAFEKQKKYVPNIWADVGWSICLLTDHLKYDKDIPL